MAWLSRQALRPRQLARLGSADPAEYRHTVHINLQVAAEKRRECDRSGILDQNHTLPDDLERP